MNTTIILGATGGIGSRITERLANQGRALHLIARDASRLAALAAATGASVAAADVLDHSSLRSAIAAAPGPIEALAYCIGSIDLSPFARVTPEQMRASYELNVVSAVVAIQAALPTCIDGASVVLFSSVAASVGFTQHVAIASAKAALEGCTRSLAADLAPRVRVNAIAPSLTRTPLANRFTSVDGMEKAIAQLHPLPRIGEADDIAALASLLLSPEAGWITGQVYAVDGGRSTVRNKG